MQRIAWFVTTGVCFTLIVAHVSSPQPSSAEEIPAPYDAALAERLVVEGMPEPLDRLLSGAPPASRVLLARAYANAAAQSGGKQHTADLDQAEHAFRAALSATETPEWQADPARRLAAIRWRIELADFLLRQRCADSLDAMERRAGLAPPSPQFAERLAEVVTTYRAADRALVQLRTELAEGDELLVPEAIGRGVPALARRTSLNLAWALVYRSTLRGRAATGTTPELDEALQRFEGVVHESTELGEKYSALIGAGVAFRESGRFEDAEKVLAKAVAAPSADATIRCRARHELARMALRRKQGALAARLFAENAAEPIPPAGASDLGDPKFFIELAPLLGAYAIAASDAGETERGAAINALLAHRGRGGDLGAAAEMLLDQVVPRGAAPQSLSRTDRFALAGRLKGERRFEEAITAYRAALEGPETSPAHASAGYELGECLLEVSRPREAAAAFAKAALVASDAELAGRAAAASLDAWRRQARASGLRSDELELAAGCAELAERVAALRDADEYRLVAAEAFERVGECERARQLLGIVGPASRHFWPAQCCLMRCRQAIFQAGAERLAPAEAQNEALALAVEWDRLAAGLRDAASAEPARAAEWRAQSVAAQLNGAELLAGPYLQRHADALQRFESLRVDELPAEAAARALSGRVRCYRASGQFQKCADALAEMLKRLGSADAGPALLSLAADLESEVAGRIAAGRTSEAAQLANDSIPVIRRLLEWIEADPTRATDTPTVRFSLARAYVHAGRGAEAMPLLEPLERDRPGDREVRRYLARAAEALAHRPGALAEQSVAAERRWANLLEERDLRTKEPAIYWEARYHWLAWQLERGRSAEVAAGIASEQSWNADLGGPVWREKFAELRRKAEAAPAASPAPTSRSAR